MAAVRCAARRLAGSLLHRTQAVVAEEGRQLAPSRFMRSRRLSSKVPIKPAGETHKEQRPSDWQSLLEHERAKMDELIKKYESYPRREPPDPSYLRIKSIIRSSNEVINGPAKLAFFVLVTATVFGDVFGDD